MGFAALWPEAAAGVFGGVQGWIVESLGWYYMLVVAAMIVFALIFGLSKYDRIKIGRDEDEPEFGVLSWFCMLFAAEIGIGLVFYGIGEPLT